MTAMNSISDAQSDMRIAYLNGAPGIITSGSAWLIAGIFAFSTGSKAGIMALIFGGMLIFPVSVLFCKVLGRTGKHSKDNPLAPLAIEGTLWMLLSIPVAIGVSLYKVEWFFPAMLLVIAGRYLTFSTLYGMRVYWAFSAALVIASFLLIRFDAPVFYGALSGAAIEFVFGLAIFILFRFEKPN